MEGYFLPAFSIALPLPYHEAIRKFAFCHGAWSKHKGLILEIRIVLLEQESKKEWLDMLEVGEEPLLVIKG